jgi:hypothetical protein
MLARPSTLILFAVNLYPFLGVLAWGWDAFVLLMLYWLETAVIAFWTVVRIATMSRARLDALGVKFGAKNATSSVGVALFVTLHAGIFMGVHLFILWGFFSGAWSRRIEGVGAFVRNLVIDTGLWLPLLAVFLLQAALVLYDALAPKLRPSSGAASDGEPLGTADGVAVIGLYVRIFVMQTTILLGAWAALAVGTAGALAVLIVLKCAVDLFSARITDKVRGSIAKAQAEKAALSN